MMPPPTLPCGSENWTFTEIQASRIQAADFSGNEISHSMRFLRHVEGYTLHDHKRNVAARLELNIMIILDTIARF